MSNINNGGPAFPFIDSASPLEHSGMTLRDYFAAKAMQGFMVNTSYADDDYYIEARAAYLAADSMLRARGEA